MNFKNSVVGIIGMIMVVNFLAPVFVFAQTEGPKEVQQDFCSRLAEISSKLDQRIAEKTENLEARRAERLGIYQNLKIAREKKLTDNRLAQDAVRQRRYRELESWPISEAQKEAVRIFKEAIETAVRVRRESIDAAAISFQQEVDKAINSRKAAVDNLILSFTNSVKAAIEKAKNDCLSGTDSKTVRKGFQAALKKAREKFQSDRQQIEKQKTSLRLLIAQKDQAIEKAIVDFKVATEKARQELENSFSP